MDPSPELDRLPSFSSLQFDLTPDPITIPYEHSAYAGFKRRLWVTWHLRRYLGAGWSLGQERLDLWLWEDEDEQYLEGFALSRSGLTAMTTWDWARASSAFEVHRSQSTTFVNPLAHLTYQNRLSFIIWLNLTKYGKLSELIGTWGNFLLLPRRKDFCPRCGISGFLNTWLEIMREVYPLEDLQLILWEYQCGCLAEVFRSLLLRAPRVILAKTSPILRALYRLVVPTWPVTLWMAFRASNGIDVPTFLDILQDPVHQDVVLNDEHDFASWEIWADYGVEIDLKTWLQIRNTVCKRARRAFYREVRVAAACLIFSPSPESGFSRRVLEELGMVDFPFDTMTLVVNKNYKPRSNYAQFALKEFWTSRNLENWIETRRLDFCHAVWQTSNLGVLERLFIIRNTLLRSWAWAPQHLLFHIYCLMSRTVSDSSSDVSEKLLEALTSPMKESDIIRVLADYSSNFDTIFTVLKELVKTDPRNRHTIATDVCKAISADIYDIAANLVFVMQEADSRARLLASRDEQAQRLLDLMQDLLDLDSFSVVRPLICKRLLELSEASGRHPHCFALSGLQKVGRQVAAGGFGDIWKGLVRGQSVSLKIVRLFEDSDIKAVLKDFTREAFVWRQLCHPNLLPFFGLYYFDTRLCLVSPWMENGNIMQFLKREPIMMIMVRVSLMLDVALGLQYLHEHKVIHGDLKAINVLVTPSRRACICDFGLSSIVNEITLRLTQSTSVAQKGTPRYYAPELLRPQGKKSFASDVYAFACVCYEILTEKLPFYEEKNDMVVMFQVLAHGRPSRPTWCTGTPQLDNLWDLLQSCWEDDPPKRPEAFQIVDRLVGPLIHATTTSSTTDWDEKFTSRFRRSSQARPLLPSIPQVERMLFGDEVAGGCKDCFPDPEESESDSEESESDSEDFESGSGISVFPGFKQSNFGMVQVVEYPEVEVVQGDFESGSEGSKPTEKTDSPELGRQNKRRHEEVTSAPNSPDNIHPEPKRWRSD